MLEYNDLVRQWKEYILNYKIELEKERKWEIFNFYVSFDMLFLVSSYIFFLGFLICCYTIKRSFYNFETITSLLGILLFLVCLCIFATKNFIKQKKTAFFKIKDRMVFRNFFSKAFRNLTFMQKVSFFDIEELKQSKMFRYNIREIIADDNFYGDYKNIKYKISEVKLCKDYLSGEFFKGVVFAFDFNKKMEKSLVICPKKDSLFYNFSTLIACHLLLLSAFIYIFYLSNYKLVEKLIAVGFILLLEVFFCLFYREKRLGPVLTESVNFEKKYSIISDSQIESRYILTPSFIERFLNLERVFNTNKISCSVFNNIIMFAIETDKDFFEMDNIFIPIDDERHVLHFYKEIEAIVTIIDSLKINENIKL